MNRGVSADRLEALRALERAGILDAYLRARLDAELGRTETTVDDDPIRDLDWHFAGAQKRTRAELAAIVAALRAYGDVDDPRNATGVLERRLARHGVTFRGAALTTRLGALAEEGLLERVIDGRRTKRLALTAAGRAVTLPERALPPPNGKIHRATHDPPLPGPDARHADLQRHFEAAHADLVDTLRTQDEWRDPLALARLDGALHRREEPRVELRAELAAIAAVVEALGGLDPSAALRVLRYVTDRFRFGSDSGLPKSDDL